MDEARVCPKCNGPMVYHIEEKHWACEQCEGAGKWSEDGVWNGIKRSGPFKYLFGPMQFEKATRKATSQLIKGLRGLLLGAGLVLALLMFYSKSTAVVCCTVYGIIIGLIGMTYVFRSARSIRNVKPPEDPMAAKGYKWSLHYLFPNFLVIACFIILAFLVLTDMLTLGPLEQGNMVISYLHGIRGVAWLIDHNPMLLPIILWYSACRTMIMSYYEAFDSGRSIAFKNHDRRLTARYHTDKWYKRILIKGMRGFGYASTGLSIFYAAISVGIFILNIYLFGQDARERFLGGMFSGYRIVYIELTCLLIMFFATLWVTTYSISKLYPNTVFTTWGMMSNKMKVDPTIEMAQEKDGKGTFAKKDATGVITVKERPQTASKGSTKKASGNVGANRGAGKGAGTKGTAKGTGKAKDRKGVTKNR